MNKCLLQQYKDSFTCFKYLSIQDLLSINLSLCLLYPVQLPLTVSEKAEVRKEGTKSTAEVDSKYRVREVSGRKKGELRVKSDFCSLG